MCLRASVLVCLFVYVSDWQLICISSEQILRRVTGGEIKIASLVRASQSPSLLFKCCFAHQNPNGVCACVCVFACIWVSLGANASVYACVLETVGVFSPSISKQYSFEI